MSLHRDAVNRNPLFQEFDKLAGFEDVSKSDIDILKAMVLEVAEKVGPHLDWVQHTFQQYTIHHIQHLLNIADHIHSFLPRVRGRRSSRVGLNAVELTYLWLAILLHDVGMFVSQTSEKQVLLDSPDYKDFLRHHRDRLKVAQAAETAGRTVTAQAIHDALFAEFIRRRHAERVHDYIRTHLKDRLRFREIDLTLEVGNLCESHNWGVRESRDALRREQCVEQLNRRDGVGKTRVNMAYLACCLRLGDILDFDRSRTPLSAFHQIHFTESLSVQEWNKHLSIKRIDVTEHRVQYVAKCATPADYVAVHQFLEWVDRELQECTRLVREFPQEDARRYVLNLAPVVDRYQIQMANPQMVAGGFRFQLEYDRIMQLLMDKSLYPDETLFLRELLQNALDACRYQRALAQDKGMGDKYVPRIQVWDHSTAKHDPVGRDAGPRIVFRDNGVGMSLHQVGNYFMRVGKSFYTSTDFQAERERLAQKGIHLEACSQFGIGFLSCFLGGDRIEVETYRYGSEPLKIAIDGPSKYFVIERLKVPPDTQVQYNSPPDPSLDSPPRCSGTQVTVFLRDGWRKNPSESPADLVYRTLDAVAVNQEIPITVTDPTSPSPRVLEASRWDRVPPKMYGYDPDSHPSYLAPSVLSLAAYGDSIRGQGAIWFLSDAGCPVVRKGDLVLRGNEVGLGEFLIAACNLFRGAASRSGSLSKTLRKALVEALVDLRTNQTNYSTILERLKNKYPALSILSDQVFLDLTLGDIDWVIKLLQKPLWNSNTDWNNESYQIQTLLDCDRNQLARMWHKNGVPTISTLVIGGEYHLALFGIESPGGFQTWDAVGGTVFRYTLTPRGVNVNIDTYGDLAPKPAASRLYVPEERSACVRTAVARAFLLHARYLWQAHAGSDDWTKWYESFMSAWDFDVLARLRDDSDVWHLLTEFREARPKRPNAKFYRMLGGVHSPFGAILLPWDEYRWGGYEGDADRSDDLDLLQPIPRDDINYAAAKVGLDPGKIDSTVESLSEFLGWDITKGHPPYQTPTPPPKST
jgi:hypothetical protein